MNKIVIVDHSGHGHIRKVVETVAEGRGGALLGIDAEARVPEGAWEQLAAADAIVFVPPTYMGTLSWHLKRFEDASSKAWYTQDWKKKLAAAFTNSASMKGEKLSTLHDLFTHSQQHSMFWVGPGIMPIASKAATGNDINYVASFSGLMTATPSGASPDEMVPRDIATAKKFDERIAEAVAKFASSPKSLPRGLAPE